MWYREEERRVGAMRGGSRGKALGSEGCGRVSAAPELPEGGRGFIWLGELGVMEPLRE